MFDFGGTRNVEMRVAMSNAVSGERPWGLSDANKELCLVALPSTAGNWSNQFMQSDELPQQN
jgi:hypothetical protein